MFGPLPAYGFYFRHVKGIEMNHVKLDYNEKEERNAFVLDDVVDAYFDHINIERGSDNAPFFDLRNVSDFVIENSPNIKPIKIEKLVERKKIE